MTFPWVGIETEIEGLGKPRTREYLKWFGRMLENHFDGIIAHARFRISAGKIEGINNRIKTIRRMEYGYPDDEYFFLKLIDMSRSKDT